MPLTPFQERVAILLAKDRSPDSYLAGGAALHVSPTSQRYSNDLDYFQDSVERVTSAFAADRSLLERNGFAVEFSLRQAGFARAVVSQGSESTKVDWAHDAPWRFLPPMAHPVVGYLLHPVDLAVNKLLALVDRDEPRDFLDVMFAHQNVLALGALAAAKSRRARSRQATRTSLHTTAARVALRWAKPATENSTRRARLVVGRVSAATVPFCGAGPSGWSGKLKNRKNC